MRVDSFLRNGFLAGESGAGPGDMGATGAPSRGEVTLFKSGEDVSIGGGGDGLDEVEPIISIWLLGVWGGLCGSPDREDDAPVPFRDGDGEASLFLFRRGLFFVRMGD